MDILTVNIVMVVTATAIDAHLFFVGGVCFLQSFLYVFLYQWLWNTFRATGASQVCHRCVETHHGFMILSDADVGAKRLNIQEPQHRSSPAHTVLAEGPSVAGFDFHIEAADVPWVHHTFSHRVLMYPTQHQHLSVEHVDDWIAQQPTNTLVWKKIETSDP